MPYSLAMLVSRAVRFEVWSESYAIISLMEPAKNVPADDPSSLFAIVKLALALKSNVPAATDVPPPLTRKFARPPV